MADREKVIKGLEEVDAYFHHMTEVCYRGDEATFCDLKEKVADAIALLKDGSDYKWNDNHGELIRCAECRHGELDTEHFTRPSIVCKNPANGVGHVSHRPTWFCADGERR